MNCTIPLAPRAAPRSRRQRSPGSFSLIEVIVYVAVLAVLMGIGYGVLVQSITNSLAFRRSTDDIARVLRAGEKWRSDVRASTDVRLEAGPGEQILHVHGARGEISYRSATNCLYRRDLDRGWTPVLMNVKATGFVRDSRQHVTAWRWELELQKRSRQHGTVQPLFTFIAVPTGNSSP
jgi:hypothetical protein